MSAAREDRIRQRAHEIWLREGQPEGASERHWLEASGEIDAEDKAVKKPAAKKAAPAKKAASPAAPATAAKKAPAKKPAK